MNKPFVFLREGVSIISEWPSYTQSGQLSCNRLISWRQPRHPPSSATLNPRAPVPVDPQQWPTHTTGPSVYRSTGPPVYRVPRLFSLSLSHTHFSSSRFKWGWSVTGGRPPVFNCHVRAARGAQDPHFTLSSFLLVSRGPLFLRLIGFFLSIQSMLLLFQRGSAQ